MCLHPRCSYLPETTCEYDSLYSPRSDSSLSSHRPCDLGVCQYFFLTIQSDTISRPYSHGNKQHIKNLRASVQNPKSRQLRKSQVRVIHAIQNKSVTVDGSTIYNFIIQGKDQKYQRANIFSSTIYIKFKVTKFM